MIPWDSAPYKLNTHPVERKKATMARVQYKSNMKYEIETECDITSREINNVKLPDMRRQNLCHETRSLSFERISDVDMSISTFNFLSLHSTFIRCLRLLRWFRSRHRARLSKLFMMWEGDFIFGGSYRIVHCSKTVKKAPKPGERIFSVDSAADL